MLTQPCKLSLQTITITSRGYDRLPQEKDATDDSQYFTQSPAPCDTLRLDKQQIEGVQGLVMVRATIQD